MDVSGVLPYIRRSGFGSAQLRDGGGELCLGETRRAALVSDGLGGGSGAMCLWRFGSLGLRFSFFQILEVRYSEY